MIKEKCEQCKLFQECLTLTEGESHRFYKQLEKARLPHKEEIEKIANRIIKSFKRRHANYMKKIKTIEDSIKEFDKIINKQFGLNASGGSYIYHLTRHKSAFEIGTMTLDDFVEIDDDEWLNEFKELFKHFITKAIKDAFKATEVKKAKQKDVLLSVSCATRFN